MKPESDDASNLNEKIMGALRSQLRLGRALMALALALGILSIVASIALAWANVMLVMPMERLLLADYPASAQRAGKNAEGNPTLPREELDWRHIQVTAAHGKAMFLTAASIALLASGTLVILILVIFNRRVTLRQINLSLAQISNQIKELQRGQNPGSAG